MFLSNGGTNIATPINSAVGIGETKVLQANLAANLNSATFVSGNSNTVLDTAGNSNWQFYVAGNTSVAAITSSSASSEWTGGTVLSANDAFAGTLLFGATYVADAGSRVPGKNYLKLPNSTGNAKCASISPFTPTTNGISFSFWIRHTAIDANNGAFFFNFRDANNVNQTFIGGSFYFGAPGFLSVSNNSGNPESTGIPFSSVGDGNWHHIAWTMTYSASTTSTWKFYLDGVVSAGTTLTSKSYMNLVTRTYHNIGNYNDQGDIGYAINGGVDNFRVYQKVLSDAEVLADVADTGNLPTQLSDSISQSPVWKLKPAIAVNSSETSYTIKNNEIAIAPGTNSTYAVWTAPKTTNIKVDVSFADYHSRNVGVGFQMFKINNDNTFGSVIYPRTVTSTALTNANPNNYLSVPSKIISVATGDKIYLRVDANGNPTSASSVLSTNIYVDPNQDLKQPNLLQAHLGNNMAATTFVSGNANVVNDTRGTGSWKFYVAGGNSIASVTGLSNSTEWTGGSLLSYSAGDYSVFYPFNTNTVSGSTVLNAATNAYDLTLYGGASIINTTPFPATQPPSTGSGYLNMNIGAGHYAQPTQPYSFNPLGSTISFWVRWTSGIYAMPAFSYGTGSNFFLITLVNFGTFSYSIRNGASQNSGLFAYQGGGFPFNYAHITLVTGTGAIYINGVLGAYGNYTLPTYGASIQPTWFYFGNIDPAINNISGLTIDYSPKTGTIGIDNFVVYNKTLTATEVMSLYAKTDLYYPLKIADINSGNTTQFGDVSTGPYVYNGALVNGATIVADANSRIAGQGYLNLVSASSHYATLSTFTTGSTGLSVACWFRSNATANYARICEFAGPTGTTYSNNIILGIVNSKFYIGLFIGTGGGGGNVINIGSTLLNDNVWRHVVLTLHPTSGWTLYLNGVSYYTNPSGIYPSAVSRNNNYIGKSFFGDPYFNGGVDDFRIYNRVITAAEISYIYAGPPQPTLKDDATGVTWMSIPATPVNSSETSYTVKNNEVALTPGTNSTFAVWTATKSTNIKVDVSFADYHSRSSAGVGFQMFKIKSDNTFDSVLFPRTVTSTALTNAAPNNYLPVPTVSTSVSAGDKIYLRVDANGNTTAASSVLATTIFTDAVSIANNPVENRALQANLASNLNATTFVSGNANVVLDTLGTSNWQFYVASSASVAAITSSSASTEWTGGSLLGAQYAFDGTLVNGATIVVDAGSRVPGNPYLKMLNPSGTISANTKYAKFTPFSIPSGGMSFSVWAKHTYIQGNAVFFVDIRGNSLSNIFLALTQAGELGAASGGGLITVTGYKATITDGNWHHLVWTISASGLYKFYLDNSLISTNQSTHPGAGLRAFYNIGSYGDSGDIGYAVNGAVDNFKFFSSELTASEVTAEYNNTASSMPFMLMTDSGVAPKWSIKPATLADPSETSYTVKSNEIALLPGTNSTYAVWTSPKTTNIKVDVSFADYHTRSSAGVGFQMFKINADNTFGSVIYPRTVTSVALTNANPNNYLSVPSRTVSVATGDKIYYRVDANGNTTAASSVLATTIYIDPNQDLKQYNVLQANLGNNMAATTFVSGNANVVNDTRGTGNWKFYVAGGNSIASITGSSNSTEWTGGSLLSTNDTFTGTLLNGATYVADAGSRVPGKNYLKLDNLTINPAKCASILPFTPTTNGISFSFWIKHTEIVGTYGAFFFVFRNPGNANMTYIGGTLATGYLAVTNNSGGEVSTGIPFSSVANGNWHHIAWTMTYSASNTSTWKFYLDGVAGTPLINRSYMNLVTLTYYTLGCVEDAALSYAINGGIDNFRVYHKVLSDAEVLADVADVNNLPTQLSDSMSQSSIWKLKPAIAVDDTETSYTVKSNEIALKPGTNSTFAVWTATKSTNLKIDVSFADYHTRSSAGVGFQMFKIKSDNTFDSVLFPRTVTSAALTNAAPNNYLPVPSVTTTVIPGDKIYLRVDANGNTTATSSVLATNIYTDAVSAATNPAETRTLQANLASNLNATTLVSGNANVVLDTVGNGDWKFYVGPSTSTSTITSSSASSEWTGGSLLSYNEIDYYMFYPFNTNGVSGSTLLNLATNSYGATLYGGASIVNTVPSPATQPPVIGSGYLNMDIGAGQHVQLNQTVSLNSSGSTISFWFRWSANVSNDGTPIFSYDDGTDYLIIYMWGNGTCVICAKRNGITNSAYVFGTNDLAPFTMGDWVHLSILTGTGKTYVNGIVLLRDTITGFSSIQPTKMYFGNSSASASFLMDYRTFSTKSGTVGIDNFVIHNKTLSDEEIGALYSNSRIYYTFDSDSVSGINVGNKSKGTYVNDATLVNSASIGTSNPSSAPTSGTGHLQLTSTNTIATNQYVQLSVVPDFIYQSNKTAFSVSFWARSNSTLGSSAKNNFFDFANSIAASENANYSFSMYLQSNNIRGKISYGASGVAADDYVMQTDSSILTDNVWRHYVWTVDSAVRWKLYINSVLVFTKSSGFNLGYPMDYYAGFGGVSYANSFIGRDAGSWQTASFSGAIDEFRWYKSRVIGQAEVSVLYATQVSVGKFQNPSGGNPTWIAKPTFAVDSTETSYTVKSNEIALTPGTNSTYAVWTAPKSTNIRVDVSFADYHSRTAGVGFQMFKINNDNTFGSTIFPRTVTSAVLTNAAPTNYLNVPSVSLSVSTGDKIYYRIDANGNTTSASSVIATNIYAYSGSWS